ncbi:hypothetical protein FA95DRAFT_1189269 [Auriscalpium vulgare]|uniref:Uncharacterized protein n=1 Tax=Auriscalpium vulgare TaxID=40419 RepID=A0ACB8RVD3_9AGAM|nr:hypothetical protein FA95DRAFT_1189269 [Auriscalpium vulgare]
MLLVSVMTSPGPVVLLVPTVPAVDVSYPRYIRQTLLIYCINSRPPSCVFRHVLRPKSLTCGQGAARPPFFVFASGGLLALRTPIFASEIWRSY